MRSTRGQIIDQALQRVGNTTSTLIVQARIRLNRILQELYQGADWPFLWFEDANVAVRTDGLVLVPDPNFLKPEDTESLVIVSAGGQPMRHVVHEVDHRAFSRYAARPWAASQAGPTSSPTATVPTIWTVDYGGTEESGWLPSGRAWPAPREQCQATLRYKWLPLDVPVSDAAAYDADIPAFPWDLVLTDLLFEWAMSYEVDPRRAEQLTINVESIARSRGASFPERSYPSQVPLDPLFFSTPWRGD
jgi:hypothetical protein